MKKITVTLSENLHRQLMIACAMSGSKMTEIMRKAAIEFCQKTPAGEIK